MKKKVGINKRWEKMEKGEKFLSISLFGGAIKPIPAFPNKKKKEKTDPDFVGNGVAVWVNKKGEGKKEDVLWWFGEIKNGKIL